jgi:hypothetical protein
MRTSSHMFAVLAQRAPQKASLDARTLEHSGSLLLIC